MKESGVAMFVGHYGPAAAVAGNRIKLWHGVVAVQFLDILWSPFVLLGIEHVRIVENFTASNHFDLYHMPYTHSLLMALVWSVLAGGAYGLLRKRTGMYGAIMIGALVFSHWIFDFITHKPDLELWFGGPKVGLSLWDNRPLAIGVELGLLLVGGAIYMMRTEAKGVAGKILPYLFLLILVAAQLAGNFSPATGGPDEAAMAAIISYGVFVLLAMVLDVTRAPKDQFSDNLSRSMNRPA
ncbi:MAG: hypothetical protein DHS20C05_17450 [Hyphococcus sp.]|nr:MAG: hypothetical protein DHS20C05_17450 [Marinicaulis sp.]